MTPARGLLPFFRKVQGCSPEKCGLISQEIASGGLRCPSAYSREMAMGTARQQGEPWIAASSSVNLPSMTSEKTSFKLQGLISAQQYLKI